MDLGVPAAAWSVGNPKRCQLTRTKPSRTVPCYQQSVAGLLALVKPSEYERCDDVYASVA